MAHSEGEAMFVSVKATALCDTGNKDFHMPTGSGKAVEERITFFDTALISYVHPCRAAN